MLEVGAGARAKVSTWLTALDTLKSIVPDPEQALLAQEASALLEDAVTALPDACRVVFMLRDVEGSARPTRSSRPCRRQTVGGRSSE